MTCNVKLCRKCNTEKPFSGFHKGKSGTFGLQSHCKVCSNSYGEKYRRDNPDYQKEYYSSGRRKNYPGTKKGATKIKSKRYKCHRCLLLHSEVKGMVCEKCNKEILYGITS